MKSSKVYKIKVISTSQIDYDDGSIMSEIEDMSGIDFNNEENLIFGKETFYVSLLPPTAIENLNNRFLYLSDQFLKLNEQPTSGPYILVEELISFLNPHTASILIMVLEKNGCKVELKEITDEFINENKTFLDSFGISQDVVKEFKEDNISLDDILDKISRNGIESLTEIDKEIISKFKK